MNGKSRMTLSFAVLLVGLFVSVRTVSAQQREEYVPQSCQVGGGPGVYKLSGQLALKFCEFKHPKDPVDQQKAYYDFMWQSFIAVNWPHDESKNAIRGQPNFKASILDIKGSGKLPVTVWETYREPEEVFLPPSEWDKYPNWNDPRKVPKPLPEGVRTLKPYSDSFLEYATDLNQPDFFPKPTGPLVDQKKGYLWYEVAVNQAFFTYIKHFKYYDGDRQIDAVRASLLDPKAKGGFQRPPFGNEAYLDHLQPFAKQGFVDVKAAWRVLKEDDHHQRYLHRKILTKDGVKLLGLVGLHILRWTPNGPGAFVASTFEHVDNVRVGQPAGHPIPPKGLTPSFNTGSAPTSMQYRLGFQGKIPTPITQKTPRKPPDQRKPVSIYRVTDIPSTPKGKSVQDANRVYQLLLKDSVFSYYELIGTQNKHTGPFRFKTRSDLLRNGHQGPKTGVYSNTSNLINTALESYTQANHSCIQCHVVAGPQGVPTQAKELDQFRSLTFLLQMAKKRKKEK